MPLINELNMDTKDWIMTISVIMGPILAVQAQKFLENFSEKRERRVRLFKTLMSTRAERLNRDHVQALNMIDIEFYGRMIPLIRTRYQTQKEQAVTHCWKNYNNHLGQRNTYESGEAWLKKCDDLFTDLLYAMAQSLNYDYDKVQLQRDCYRPEAHGTIENIQLNLLTGLESIVKGDRSLPMAVTSFPGVNNPDSESSLETPGSESKQPSNIAKPD
ncbi:DUF6680 family protein [Methylomonas sp. LWB]|uniref:DUF6680 family protein n=1 Tax=Methylomonas sp. LWB TaxID=1905845 RepID=UPI0009F523D2|nr:DUF6680 family protein [Methylomonas sp. LWB]